MIILVFLLILTLAALCLAVYAGVSQKETASYDLRFVKGAARGVVGRFASSVLMEQARERVNCKKSKF